MGICIHYVVAKSVTKEEWESVYRESLKLIEAFPLADIITVELEGIEIKCLVRTMEKEHVYGWPEKKAHTEWRAVGDYIYMRTAEPYYLPKDLVEETSCIEDCEDAMFAALPAYLAYDSEDKRFDCYYDKWGAKTQGEPYHMYLLAIACLIESRLGTKAFIYGDITRGQCFKAVAMANEILEKPIKAPDRCFPEKLLARVDTLPVSKLEKLEIFECFYLGNKNVDFGEALRKYFNSKTLNEYWGKRFSHFNVGHIGFNDVFCDYL